MCITKVPLISFVVPVYNAERTLHDCVRSLIKQTFGNIEIILVNNCSTDESLGKCNELAKEDERVKVVDIAEKGVSAARNRGIELATGEYIAFVDADDWVDSNVCELFADLNAKYDYDLFCYSAQYHKKSKTTTTYLFGKDIELLSQNQKEELQIKVFAPQAPIFSYKTNTRFVGSAWGKFYKREILLKNNLRFATETIISEDVLFNTLSLDNFQRIGYTKRCFYNYEQSSDSAQNRYRPNSDKYFMFVIEKIQEWLQNTGKDQRFVDAANCLFVHYLFGILKEDLFHKNNRMFFVTKVSLLKIILNENWCTKILQRTKKAYFTLLEIFLVNLLLNKKYWTVSIFLTCYCKLQAFVKR
ncbi:glycosyltransferase family 2 protein [Fibrobacter sp. UWR2]|uniref:glycosyltransferase n=1 Tax=Fibrobacter sp. UWR2 TaxID=1964352 RepID=UPI000B525D03|nr:glycosyltransferase family 2 protein [Fibrobacter sp. UWR2]OWV00768.1 hypothetical protein B7994_06920 [Fibrobacter sp. UWR2]